jgi:hypothetical protein
MDRDLSRIARLSALIRQVRVGAAGASRAHVDMLQAEMEATCRKVPPEGTDPPTAAQHARWVAARRRALAAALAAAQQAAQRDVTAARRAIGVDGAIDALARRLDDARRRTARRD